MTSIPHGTPLKDEDTKGQPSPVKVNEELRRILESHPFRTTRQCQDLLRYIVQHSFSFDDAPLKERVIGVEVFGRQANYDTSEDPVVRVRAADVRKRLAQYYQLHGNVSPLLYIELAPGSYRAHFREEQATEVLPSAASVAPTEAIPYVVLPHTVKSEIRRTFLRRSWPILLILLLVSIAGVSRWIQSAWRSPLERFWAPFVSTQHPVLLYMGTNAVYTLSDEYLASYRREHGIVNNGAEFYPQLPPEGSLKTRDVVPSPETFVAAGDIAGTVQIVSLLRDWKKPFVLRFGRDLAFGDLRNQPSVMIGAFNNLWTLEFTNDLPFSFKQGTMIKARDQPGRVWTRPPPPGGSTTEDYALISRLMNSKTGGPLIIIAGIGVYGTQGAAEFVANPDKMQDLLKSAPPNWEENNMQAVLHIKAVGYSPVAVEVVATSYW